MGQAQPFSSERPKAVDYLATLRRLVGDLEAGRAAIVKDGVDVTRLYTLILEEQVRLLETIIE